MRIDVKKYLFVGAGQEKKRFFEKAQNAGLVHFIETGPALSKELPQDVQDIVNAIKVLRGLPVLDQVEPSDPHQSKAIADKVLDLKHRIEKYSEEKRVLGLEISRISIFGEFSLDDIAYIEKEGNRVIEFYFSKKGSVDLDALPENVLFVDTDHGLDYFIAVNREPKQYESMVRMRIEKPLKELKERYEKLGRMIHDADTEVKTYVKYNEYLHHVLIHKMNQNNLRIASDYAKNEIEQAVFTAQGWVPEDKVQELEQLVSDMDVYVNEIAVEEGDQVPTYLENKGLGRIGEDLVHVYDTPSMQDKDPSLWVLISFAIFFAMIIGDGGYGLIFLGAALYFKYKFSKAKHLKKRILNLFLILSVATLGWGIFTNSFFGIKFTPDSPFRKVSVINWLAKKKVAYHIAQKDDTYKAWVEKYPKLKGIEDSETFILTAQKVQGDKIEYELLDRFYDNIMLEIALVVGMIHITLSLLRYVRTRYTAIGWVIFIWGCYLYFPSYLNTASMTEYVFGADLRTAALQGWYMIFIGLGLSVVLAFIKDKFFGILEVTQVIQVFADILSYLRLYALGLAGAIISATVNEIAGTLVFGAGILLVVVGHFINMVLAVVGGIIHGLRLNFIEWYHYSFDGGGKPFAPLKKMEID